MTNHFLQLDDLTPTELESVLTEAAALKAALDDGESHSVLSEQTLGMLFEKPSTRTRISFETGMTQLGGHAIFFGPDETQLGRGEPLADTARALSQYVDFVMARVDDHDELETLAEYGSIPVVNGLSDLAHPVQTLADLLTIQETFGGFDDVSAAWVGDGNNVGRSFAVGCGMVDLDLTVATPEGYGFDADERAEMEQMGASPTYASDPVEAVQDADVVYTDVWVSMGQEDEREEKLAAFEGYQLNQDLLSHAPDATVMHCLPAHRGEEITVDVLEGEQSVVWRQAENRLHAQKALLVHLSDAEETDERRQTGMTA